jgi:hypothetical protein
VLWILDKIYIFFVNTYIYIETPRPNTNRHFHAHKCLHCADIEPVTSCVVGSNPTTTPHRPLLAAIIITRKRVAVSGSGGWTLLPTRHAIIGNRVAVSGSGGQTLVQTHLFPTLIPLSEVGTTCFSSCCDKVSAIIFTTGRLEDVYPP